MNKKRLIYILVPVAILIVGVFVFSQYVHKKPTNSTVGIDEQLRQDALLGSIATSTDGKEMIYTNLKYKFSFRYPSDWVNENANFSGGYVQLFSSDRSNKIETGVGLTNQPDSENGDDGVVYKYSTTTIIINGNKIIRADIIGKADGGMDVTMRTYRIIFYSDPSISLHINMYHFGTSTSDFSVVNNLVKSIKWLP
jgi:hypothetical protein